MNFSNMGFFPNMSKSEGPDGDNCNHLLLLKPLCVRNEVMTTSDKLFMENKKLKLKKSKKVLCIYVINPQLFYYLLT